MRTSKEYRQTAWSAIKPVLPIMLLIFLVASLPQLIFMFIQTAFGLTPPMDTDLLLSDPDAFVAAYSAFMSSSKGITYSLLNTAVYADDHSADAGHHRRGTAHSPRRGRAGAPFAGVYSLYLPRDLATDLHGVLRLLADAAGVCGGDSSAADRVVARYHAAHRHSVFHRGDCDAGARHYAHST